MALAVHPSAVVRGTEHPSDVGQPEIRVVDRREELGRVDEGAGSVDHAADATIGPMTEPADREPDPERAAGKPARTATPTLGGRMAAAVGNAMLGLEHAMRRDPPAEVVVREHQPERGLARADPDLVIEFPDDRP
jgi:hypothetical protein